MNYHDRIEHLGWSAVAAAALLDRKNKTNFINTQILNYPYIDLATDPGEKGHTREELLSYYVFPELYILQQEQRQNDIRYGNNIKYA
jgi:hypothetical protein